MTFDRRTRAAEQNAPATPSRVAGGSQALVERRPRSGLIVSAAAVLVGTTTGGALALRGESAQLPALSPTSRPADPPASPQLPARASESPDPMQSSPPPGSLPTPGTAVGAPPGSASAPPDLHAAVVAQIKAAVMRFVLWSHEHPGAQCPDAAALGAAAADPWGRSLRVLCADQPADQVAGVLSLGPDGLPGTADDIASWTLGSDVTDVLRGVPWGSSRSAEAKRPPVAAPQGAGPRGPFAAAPPAVTPRTKRSARAGAGGGDTDGDGIPDRR